MPRPLSRLTTLPSGWMRQLDVGRVTGHRLVDRVVDDLLDQVMQAADVGRADVHAGPLANRLEPLQDLDVSAVYADAAEAAALAVRGRWSPWPRSPAALGATESVMRRSCQPLVQARQILIVVVLDCDSSPFAGRAERDLGRERLAQATLEALGVRSVGQSAWRCPGGCL